jgi:phenylacetate-CoA ligase
MFYAECLDPDTLKPVVPGEIGELVLSNLCTESMPLLRFRIRDLVRFNTLACECGRTFLRLDGGILGRSDDMFQFAGVNVFPSAIENLIRQVPEFSNEYQIVIPKMGSGHKYRITITPDVEIVGVGELPRFELKAKRLIRKK